MASANAEKSSYSGFERFLFFITPILFTAVLLGVLLLLFNPAWRKAAQDVGNRIPVVKWAVPDPAPPAQPEGSTDEEITVNNAKAKVEELNALLTDREMSLKQATEQTATQKKQIEEMQAQIDQMTKENADKTITGDAYNNRIKSLAGMYTKMTPSKAAPIMESMTIEEASLVLGAMTELERGRILEKMTPKKAADVTMQLKDTDIVDDREIAALQARIKELEAVAGEGSQMLDTAELNRTFSTMDPGKASALLLQMTTTNQSKALRILGVLDDAPRSAILAAMSDEDKKKTAQLVGLLMPANP